jgi:hypothetical protein
MPGKIVSDKGLAGHACSALLARIARVRCAVGRSAFPPISNYLSPFTALGGCGVTRPTSFDACHFALPPFSASYFVPAPPDSMSRE